MWNKIPKDEGWMGGTLDVPFEGGEASSLSFGSLTDATDISESKPVLGTVTSYKELWGTMLFYEKDLDLHGNMEKSFLQILPRQLNQFVNRMSDRLSHTLLNGAHIDSLSANGGATGTGIIDVYHPERFTINEKLYIKSSGVAADYGYVIAINMNAKTVTLAASRGGSASATLAGSTVLSTYTTAQSAKVYLPGADTAANVFQSLKDALLSNANGGGASLLGQTKTSYPFLQAYNEGGTDVTNSNILDRIFEFFYATVTLGKGDPREILVSMSNFKHIAKILEVSRQFSVQDKAAGYGWRRVSVLGPDAEMDIVALRDIDDDFAVAMDWNSVKFHGSHFFDRKRHLDGNEFYLTRATTGYTYIVDVRLFGEQVISAPSYDGILYSIPSLG